MIRTGLLSIPEMDAAALDGVRGLLSRGVPGVLVMQESAVGMQRAWIAETLRRWCDEDELDLILTLGGTLPSAGPAPAECVPEATLEVLDRLVPGLPEAMRAEGQALSPLALMDRGVAGIRSRALIVNLPEGSAAAIFLEAAVEVLPSIVAHLQGSADAPRLAGLGDLPDAEAEPPAIRKGLDPGEFADFLKRKQT